MKNIRTLLLIPLLLLFASNAMANQASAPDGFGYMWTDTIGTPGIDFDWIDIKGQGIVFEQAFDDTVSGGIPLPFSFYFYGTQYNTIYISSNGWASFINPGSESYPDNGPIPGTSGQDAMLAPFWDDLASTADNNGGVYYTTEGDAPNRKFIIQWHILDGTLAEEIDFELILFEHSNLIKFQYKTVDDA